MRIPSFIARVVVLVALAACGHGEVFPAPDNATEQPHDPQPPVRLTLNPGVDRDAVWMADESALLYSAERQDLDGDRCLVLLPPAGGRVTRSFCATSTASRDSVNVYEAAAVSPGRRVAFVRTSRPPTQIGLRFNEVAVASFDSIGTATAIQSIPFTEGTTLYTDVSRMRWLDEQSVAYRAGFAGQVCVNFGAPCARAFVESGIALMRQDVGTGARTLVPGTSYAASIAVEPAGDAVLYTVLGESRVYRLVLSTGVATVFYDFGAPAGIVREVQISGNRMVALVGGDVVVLDPALNGIGTPLLQWDRGGTIVMVDLATGIQTVLAGLVDFYGKLALSPGGTRLVAERGGDLWLFELP